ncbi:MAG: MFS transporter [Chloroflexota bacterium]
MAETTRAGVDVATGARRKPRIFYGWYVVAAAAGINVYGAGVWFYGFPIFYKVLLDEFGWSAAAGAGIISLSRLEGGLEGPIIGWLVDKFGPRRMAIIGAVIAGTGFWFMSWVHPLTIGPVHINAFIFFVLLYAGWMSVGYNTGFGHASQAAVNAWFIKKRSRAFAMFSLGAGGSGLTVFALGWIINDFGWRTAAFFAGVGIFLIVIPLSLLLRHRPEQYGLLPDGDEPSERSTSDGDTPRGLPAAPVAASEERTREGPRMKVDWPEYDFSVKETLLSMAYWMLILGLSARAVAMTSVVIHEINYLTNVRDIPLVQASAALGAMVTISLVGRLGFGILADYMDKRYVLIICTLLQAVGIYLLANVTTMTQVWVFVVVYGISYGGAIPVTMAIVGEYFGRKNFATIRGWMQLCNIPTTVLGPVYAGWVYDTTGNYQIAFTTFIVALVVGTVFIFLARRPPPPVGSGRVERALSTAWPNL